MDHRGSGETEKVHTAQVTYQEGMVLEHLLDKNQCIKFGDGLDNLLHFLISYFYQLTIVLLTWQWIHPSFGYPRVLLQETNCGHHTPEYKCCSLLSEIMHSVAKYL